MGSKTQKDLHSDDLAVDRFATAMKAKEGQINALFIAESFFQFEKKPFKVDLGVDSLD